MKILVTGASGNVVSHVVNELLKLNERVKVAGTNIKKFDDQFGKKVDSVYFDFKDRTTFKKALENVDRVFLMRPPHLGKQDDLYPFIDEIKAHGIKLVSFLSLMGVENNTMLPHYKIEKYIEKLEIPYAHVRPGFFMQNLSGVHSIEIREKNEILSLMGKVKLAL